MLPKSFLLHLINAIYLVNLLICHSTASAPPSPPPTSPFDSENIYSVNTDVLTGANAGGDGNDAAVVDNGAMNAFNSNEANKILSNNNNSQHNASLDAHGTSSNHVCTREEIYWEEEKVPSMQAVRIRSSNWCLEFPPRCSNYKTEMRQIMKLENVTKTRTIRFCCDGYAGNISINDTICKPVCRGGCGRGFCLKPDVCSCDAGYTGKHCTQRCDHDHWGEECKNLCRCRNGAACDNKSGLCHCTSGWAGELCERPCPAGTYGVMCRKECDCSTNKDHTNVCHAQTGECIVIAETLLLPIVPPNLADLQPAVNVTHVMMETLNSTIVNITHNLDRIAKNIAHVAPTTADPLSYLLPDLSIAGMTTPTVPEVIVIKQNGEPHHTPKIIVHQPGGVAGPSQTPEVIHVITNWQKQQHLNPATEQQQHHLSNGTEDNQSVHLAGLGMPIAAAAPPTSVSVAPEHDPHLLTTLLIVLLVIMTAIAIGFLYVYRRYHWQRARVEAALAERNVVMGGVAGINGGGIALRPGPLDNLLTVVGSGGGGGGGIVGAGGDSAMISGKPQSYLKPLPDLPAFTQMVCTKIDAPAYYESPSSNESSLKPASYSYARKESIYSVISPKSRKCSAESHLYDEIRYPSAHHQQLQQQLQPLEEQQQQQQQQQHQPSLPHLQVPAPIPAMNYLQVPVKQAHQTTNHL